VLVVEYKEREITQLFDGLHRRTALARLTALHERNLLTEEEFARFSYEARTAVEMRKSCLT
jgi:ABC-type sulfate/molybdate transport systems ATPase subunit